MDTTSTVSLSVAGAGVASYGFNTLRFSEKAVENKFGTELWRSHVSKHNAACAAYNELRELFPTEGMQATYMIRNNTPDAPAWAVIKRERQLRAALEGDTIQLFFEKGKIWKFWSAAAAIVGIGAYLYNKYSD